MTEAIKFPPLLCTLSFIYFLLKFGAFLIAALSLQQGCDSPSSPLPI